MTQFMTAAPPEAVRVMPDGRKVTAIPARMQPMASSLTPQGLLARSMAMARSSSPRPRRTSAISMRRLVSLMEGSLFWSSRVTGGY